MCFDKRSVFCEHLFHLQVNASLCTLKWIEAWLMVSSTTFSTRKWVGAKTERVIDTTPEKVEVTRSGWKWSSQWLGTAKRGSRSLPRNLSGESAGTGQPQAHKEILRDLLPAYAREDKKKKAKCVTKANIYYICTQGLKQVVSARNASLGLQNLVDDLFLLFARKLMISLG